MCTRFLDFEIHNCSLEEILYGKEERNKGKYQLMNHVLILVKYLIYRNRELKKPPSFNEIKNSIIGDKVEERKLAAMRGTLTIHFSKWENLSIRQTIGTQSQSSTGEGDKGEVG